MITEIDYSDISNIENKIKKLVGYIDKNYCQIPLWVQNVHKKCSIKSLLSIHS